MNQQLFQKKELKGFAILSISVKSSTLNAIFESPKEYLFEKYNLHSFFAVHSLKYLLHFDF